VLVEEAAEPTEVAVDAQLADLPEVAAREVRLVGVVVADRRHHGDLALAVQRAQRVRRGRPLQVGVLGERARPVGVDLQRRAVGGVLAVADRREDAEPVHPAAEEDRDEHAARVGGRVGDPLLEGVDAELGAAVDGERAAERAREERPAVEAGAGGRGHPGLDRREAGAGARGGALQEARAGELVAAVAGGH
jgi:hypothetical protein